MKRSLVAVLAALPFVLVLACDDDDAASSGTSDGTDAQSADEPYVPNPKNCVKPGEKGNDKGVGAYCDPDVRCPSSTDPNVLLICTSTDKSTANDSYFCTSPCTLDKDCGQNAFCGHSPQGSGCVPFSCGMPPDAGSASDASDDAPSDAAGE